MLAPWNSIETFQHYSKHKRSRHCYLSTLNLPYLLPPVLCIIFCLTSLILSCNAPLVGNKSACRCWNTDVMPSDGKYPWSWKSWRTTPRRWSTGFLWEEWVGLLGSVLSSLSVSFRPAPCSKAATSASASKLGMPPVLRPTPWPPSAVELAAEHSLSEVGVAACEPSSLAFGVLPVTWTRLLIDLPSRLRRW